MGTIVTTQLSKTFWDLQKVNNCFQFPLVGPFVVTKLLVEGGFGSSPAFQNKIYPSITNRLHLNMQFHSEHIIFFFYSSTIIFECIFVNFVDFLLACRLKTMQKEYEWVEKGLEQNNASHFFALQYHCCGRRIYAK